MKKRCPRCGRTHEGSTFQPVRGYDGRALLVCSGCAKRKSVCHVCAGLPHRVVGPRCVCGLLYADEPPVTLDDVETFGASGIARAAEMA